MGLSPHDFAVDGRLLADDRGREYAFEDVGGFTTGDGLPCSTSFRANVRRAVVARRLVD